ncbi:MAG TPA: HAMP domain-containing histidine kinase [Campylobacterales bacterium]|nr:HAMP domain-containing histidine kinase [Campylobacterales bacterium]
MWILLSAKKVLGTKLIEKDKRYIYTLAFFYSMLIISVMSLPAFFYISVEKKSYKQTEMQNLEHYLYGVEKSIYDFSRTNKHIFHFPRSLFYTACLYGQNGKMLFATDKAFCKNITLKISQDEILSKKILLTSNRLHAKQLIIAKRFSYQNIYTKALIAALFLGAIIFFMTLFFIRISLRPLEKANKYLNTFFNDAIHELKTPLGVMQLNLEFLRSKEESRALRRLYNSMQSIILIYEDIEYHIKHTHVQYKAEHLNFSEFLQSRVEVFYDLAGIKNICIEEHITEKLLLDINRIELQRIIDNTISNSIKYSPKWTKIVIKLYKESEHIIFSVKDEGVGIKDTKKIFERYTREDVIQGGFGIGLSIVKYICNKNNIEISVDTKISKGSLFSYKFS